MPFFLMCFYLFFFPDANFSPDNISNFQFFFGKLCCLLILLLLNFLFYLQCILHILISPFIECAVNLATYLRVGASLIFFLTHSFAILISVAAVFFLFSKDSTQARIVFAKHNRKPIMPALGGIVGSMSILYCSLILVPQSWRKGWRNCLSCPRGHLHPSIHYHRNVKNGYTKIRLLRQCSLKKKKYPRPRKNVS